MEDNKLFQRWTAKVDFTTSPSGCWLWKGSKDKNGYGKFRIGDKVYYAATIGWRLYKGEEPTSHLYRTCGDPACVKPQHLEEKVPEPLPILTPEEREGRFEVAMRRIRYHRLRHHADI